MTAKHTPGPWKASPILQDTGDWCIHAKGSPWQVAYLSDKDIAQFPTEANAALIAAAPDLLSALKACQNFIAKTENVLGTVLSCGVAARAAIAKATGAAS